MPIAQKEEELFKENLIYYATYIGRIKDNTVFGNYTIVSPFVVFHPNIEFIYVGSSLLNQLKLSFYSKHELVKMDRLEKVNLKLFQKLINENLWAVRENLNRGVT